MLVVAGKTNLRGLPSSVRLHPPRLTALPLVLQSSIQSGNFRPFVTAPALSPMTSSPRPAPGSPTAPPPPGAVRSHPALTVGAPPAPTAQPPRSLTRPSRRG